MIFFSTDVIPWGHESWVLLPFSELQVHLGHEELGEVDSGAVTPLLGDHVN